MTAPSTGAVEVRNLTKEYGALRAVDDVSLTVERGEIYGFLGPNGAGKTTTMRTLLGLIRPSSGTVRVLGRAPGDPETLRKVGSMIESPAFYPFLSGEDNLKVLARYAGADGRLVSEVLDRVDLAGRRKDRFSSYSLGMKQRLGVAAALLKDPDLVVLDEPTNGLDPAGMRDMRALITDLGASGRTVILSSHLMSEVQEVCDRVGVINQGRMVAESTVEELRGGGELVVRATPGDVARNALEAMPEVDGVRTIGSELRVRVEDRHTALVNQRLVAAGVAVVELRRAERQLEDVFFEITGSQEMEPAHV